MSSPAINLFADSEREKLMKQKIAELESRVQLLEQKMELLRSAAEFLRLKGFGVV